MALGIGVDVVDVDRLQQQLEAAPDLSDVLFVESEVRGAQSHRHEYPRLAACLAVKEAFLKAVGIGLRDGLRFRDIEIITDAAGISGIRLHGHLLARFGDDTAAACRVSAAFTDQVACAIVLLPQKGRGTDESFRLL